MACLKVSHSVHGYSELAVLIWRRDFSVLHKRSLEGPAASYFAALPSVLYNVTFFPFLITVSPFNVSFL